MDEYKSNSHKSREDQSGEKKIEKVVTGQVKSKRKNGLQKFTDVFMSEDVDDVKSYIFEDVIVPAIKDIILDAVKAFLGANGRSDKSSNSKTPYRSYYDKPSDRKDYGSHKPRTGYSYNEIILDSRGEAESVLTEMDEIVSAYGMVSVADLYELVGVTCSHTDYKYGWTNTRSASVIRVRDGYMLKLPKAMPLN